MMRARPTPTLALPRSAVPQVSLPLVGRVAAAGWGWATDTEFAE